MANRWPSEEHCLLVVRAYLTLSPAKLGIVPGNGRSFLETVDMNQKSLERAVAKATGESPTEIRRRGFGLVDLAEPDRDIGQDDRTPLYIDWDELVCTSLNLTA